MSLSGKRSGAAERFLLFGQADCARLQINPLIIPPGNTFQFLLQDFVG